VAALGRLQQSGSFIPLCPRRALSAMVTFSYKVIAVALFILLFCARSFPFISVPLCRPAFPSIANLDLYVSVCPPPLSLALEHPVRGI